MKRTLILLIFAALISCGGDDSECNLESFATSVEEEDQKITLDYITDAEQMFEFDCNMEHLVNATDNETNYKYAFTTYFTTIDASFDPEKFPEIKVLLCDRITFGTGPDDHGCPENAECTEHGDPLPETSCAYGNAELGQDFIYVKCGESTKDYAWNLYYGYRYMKIYIYLASGSLFN